MQMKMRAPTEQMLENSAVSYLILPMMKSFCLLSVTAELSIVSAAVNMNDKTCLKSIMDHWNYSRTKLGVI